MLPVGASVCVAGRCVISYRQPVILAQIVAFSKQQILDKFRYSAYLFAFGQLFFGGIAMDASSKLEEIRSKKHATRNRFLGVQVGASQECKICLSNPCDVIFDPCNHMCCCSFCAVRVQHCPLCRNLIRRRVGVFLT